MDTKTGKTITCRQCRKDIKTEVHRCVQCDKQFHPSCIKLHKVYNQMNELIPCKGKVEVLVIAGGSGSRDRNASSSEAQILESIMESKVEIIYKVIKEIKDEMIDKTFLKRAIQEAVEEEMDRIRVEIQTWREVELEQIISSTIKKEMKNLVDMMPVVETNKQKTENTKSYSEAVINKQEAIIIIKPQEESGANSSEITKKDIKKTIDVSKLGVGITKMKKASGGAIVVGCEDKKQAEILKEKVTNELGKKYVIQDPKKKKLKIKIFNIEKEDCEKEQEFWEKIEEQNGLMKNSIQGKIVHKSVYGKDQRSTIIAEVDIKTYERMQEEGKVKIGWNICKVQNYIGILRCYKSSDYYHFAKECKNNISCGNCAGKHVTKECKNETKKCVNCEEKIKNFKIKGINSNHSAFDTNCPYYKKEYEKQRNKMYSSL